MGPNSIGNEQIIEKNIYGNINGTKTHIANETITGGNEQLPGNIAPNTIQGYNISLETITGGS
jgi:hypothetical protein